MTHLSLLEYRLLGLSHLSLLQWKLTGAALLFGVIDVSEQGYKTSRSNN